MNILLINFEYPPLGGGGGVATRDIAFELSKRHTVHVITTAFGDLPRKEKDGSVIIHRVPVLGRYSLPTASVVSLITFVPSACIAGIRIIRTYGCDVLYANFVIPSGLPALFLSKLFRIPFVITFIGGDIYDPSKGISPHRHLILRWLVRSIASRAHALTAISEDTKKRAQDLHGVTQDITVIPLGLMPTKLPSISRASVGYTEEDTLCVSIGRLVPRKGYDVLLSAWKDIPNAKLAIIGDGPLRPDLEGQIRQYGIQDRVRLLGQVDEQKKSELLSSADMYVSAAQHEGFGIVFLEAMHAGLPIVAANDGGQTDFLEDGRNALLVPPHDVAALSAAIQKLMNDQSLQNSMRRNNEGDVQHYYLAHTTQKIEELLTTVYESSH